MTLSNVLVAGNSAHGLAGSNGIAGGAAGSEARGGAIYVAAGNLTINDSIIENNLAAGGQGGARGATGTREAMARPAPREQKAATE